MYNSDVVLRNSKVADLISTGSILGWLRRDQVEESGRAEPQHVVGSGFMYSSDVVIARDNLKIHSVRGHLSRQKLDWLPMQSIAIGDPGVLVSEFASIGNTPVRQGIGFIPHHSRVDDEVFCRPYIDAGFRKIDIRTNDIDGFMTELASCEAVISQSLHGLIFADAIGVPNVWLRLQGVVGKGDFKYLDYFSTVGRDFDSGINTPPRTSADVVRMADVGSQAHIERLRSNAKKSFEEALSLIS
ncbi:polysaccharide pyruvyl transferase family protein [Gulosibacter molinativorax]